MEAIDLYICVKTAIDTGDTKKAIECAEKLALDGYYVGYVYLAKMQPKNKILRGLCDGTLKHIKDISCTKYHSWLNEYIINKAIHDSENPMGKKNIQVIQRISDNEFKQTKMPYNFSWMCDRIYGSGLPMVSEQIEIMRDIYGIKHVITIRETKLEMHVANVEFHHFPVRDMFPPSNEQLNEIVRIMQCSEPCMVHCHGGIGRTGTALVAYVLKSSFDRGVPISVPDAIVKVVRQRPWTRLTTPQEIFICAWNDNLWTLSL